MNPRKTPSAVFDLRRKALLYGILLLLMIAGVEGVSRAVFWSDWITQRILTLDDDVTWRRMWVERRRERNLAIQYAFDRYDSTKGWYSRPNFHTNELWGGKTLSTNSRGLRGTRDFSYDSAGDKLRILLLGDSFTFGDEMSDDQTYAHILQELLPEAEIINMGVHGYGHDQMLILLKEEGVKYRPDIVLVGFLYGDTLRNGVTFRDFAKPKFVWSGSELVLTNTPVPTPESVERWDWLRPRSYDLLLLAQKRFRERFFSSYQRQVDDLTVHLLDGIAYVAHSIGARPLFVYLPENKELADPALAAHAEKYLLGYCAQHGAATCSSMLPAFLAAKRQGAVFPGAGHWSAAGHLTAAMGIRDYLVGSGLLKERSRRSAATGSGVPR